MDERCQLCGLDGESIHHTLFKCSEKRQVWALSGIPQPENGFQEANVFTNINYLLNLKYVVVEKMDDKRAWLWLLWFIWKSKYDFLFNGKIWSSMEIQIKAKNESVEWFLAQLVEREVSNEVDKIKDQNISHWRLPHQGWLMCNVAFYWDKDKRLLGTAWVVRNHSGVFLIHSRRAFSNVLRKYEARLKKVLWPMKSMISLHLNKIIFAGDFKEMFCAIGKPHD